MEDIYGATKGHQQYSRVDNTIELNDFIHEFDCVSHINTTMCGSLNFFKLHQGYWGVVKPLGVFKFMLE
jgi:hypothetical protein